MDSYLKHLTPCELSLSAESEATPCYTTTASTASLERCYTAPDLSLPPTPEALTPRRPRYSLLSSSSLNIAMESPIPEFLLLPRRSSSSDVPSTGDLINDYVVDEILHANFAGGGWVVKATHRTTGDVVAIKSALIDRATGCCTEADLLEQCAHAHVVPLREVLEDHETGRARLVMPFAPDKLATVSRVKGTCVPMDRKTAARTLHQLSAALLHMHTLGVFHRDVKPENVLVDRDGTVLLADLGVSARLDPQAAVSDVCGTLQYCAPETHGATPRYLPGPVDVYALGMTMATLLAGRHPLFHASPAAMIERIVNEDAVVPAEPGDALAELLTQMLSRDADARPTMAAVHNASANL